jgi:hypothetical protein
MRSSDAANGKAPRLAAPAWLPWCAGPALAAVGLFTLYLRQARTWRVDSDAAAISLQAWEMLHGNVLLHGWWLADVTFFTTELPEYMLVESVRGLNQDVVHICSALTYTLLVLLAAVLARGHARGREGIVRALLAAGIMLSPGILRGTNALLGGPDHTGTGIPILLVLLLLDRAEEWRRRWHVPVAACLMLTWVQIADPLATYAAAAPLVMVGAVRTTAALTRRHGPREEWRYNLALTAAAAGSIPLAYALASAIRSLGGFSTSPVPGPLLGSLAAIPSHARAVGQSVLVLFGADFFGQPSLTGTALAVLHLAAVAAATLALIGGIRGFFSRLDLVSQVLVAGTIIMLGAGVFSTHVPNPSFAHEIAIVLPFSAVLSGRLLAGPLIRARLEPVLAVGLAAYLGALCYAATGVPAPAQNQAVADWLVAHHLTEGLAGYWEADSVTFDSGGRVTVAPLAPGTTVPYHWEAKAAWFDARSRYANFVVIKAPSTWAPRGFGPPARTYHYDEYTIMVWHKNLLPLLSEAGG